jgi:hypothetical protein
LPIGFEYGDHVREVVDRTTSPKRFWTLQLPGPGKSLSRDCAVVARLHDNVTEEPVIILAGILGEGTEAASEVVSNQAYLDAVLQKAPKSPSARVQHDVGRRVDLAREPRNGRSFEYAGEDPLLAGTVVKRSSSIKPATA